MSKLINIIVIGFIIISTVINLYFIYNLDRLVNERIEVLDFKPEIIILDSIEYDTIFVERTEIVKLPIVDTLVLTDTVVAVAVDSVLVEVPIKLKHFSDTLANNAISFDLRGFQCEVNNLYVENFLNVLMQEKAVNKWYNNLRVGVGLGVTYIDRFRVVPTIGIYYKLL